MGAAGRWSILDRYDVYKLMGLGAWSESVRGLDREYQQATGDSRSGKQQSRLETREVHVFRGSFALWFLWFVQGAIDSAAWLPKSGGSGPKLLVVTQPQGERG